MKNNYSAQLNDDAVVINVIKGNASDINMAGTWVQGNNRPGIGNTYREDIQAFIPPQPYPSWVLNEETYGWEAPVPFPSSNPLDPYAWKEEEGEWVFIEPVTGAQ